MANCALCGQKIPFMEGESFLVGASVQGITYGSSYTLCRTCMSKVKAAKKKDITAQNEVRILINNAITDKQKRQSFLNFLGIQKTQEELDALKKQALEQEKRDIEKAEWMKEADAWRRVEIERVLAAVREYENSHPPVFELTGSYGRNMKVYTDRAIITTSVTLGALLTNNATDGDKIIFFCDVVGIQFKEPGLTPGYLQLETTSGQMNNAASNQFSENTFTYNGASIEIMKTVRDYVTWQVSQYKGQ